MENYKLTNKDISEKFRDIELFLMASDFKSAFAYWVTYQNPSNAQVVDKSLKAYSNYLKQIFPKKDSVIRMNYTEIESHVSENLFSEIPEILSLNEMKPDFISLGALSRNVFYMILRLHITQPL